MNTFLLIVNLVMNIFIIINILDIKQNMNTTAKNKSDDKPIKKFINRIKEFMDSEESDDYFLDDFYDKDEVKPAKDGVSPRLQRLRKTWEEEDIKDKSLQISKLYTFKDVYQFLEYVSNHNLKVVDTLYGRVRTVKYLDKYTYNNEETVLITFDDNTKAVFKPHIYAKCAYYDVSFGGIKYA